MTNVVWIMNVDGRRGTVSADAGLCRRVLHASRRTNNGPNALRIVRDVLATDDVSRRVVLRRFAGEDEGILLTTPTLFELEESKGESS